MFAKFVRRGFSLREQMMLRALALKASKRTNSDDHGDLRQRKRRKTENDAASFTLGELRLRLAHQVELSRTESAARHSCEPVDKSEPPHVCELCGRAYANIVHFRTHQRKKHALGTSPRARTFAQHPTAAEVSLVPKSNLPNTKEDGVKSSAPEPTSNTFPDTVTRGAIEITPGPCSDEEKKRFLELSFDSSNVDLDNEEFFTVKRPSKKIVPHRRENPVRHQAPPGGSVGCPPSVSSVSVEPPKTYVIVEVHELPRNLVFRAPHQRSDLHLSTVTVRSSGATSATLNVCSENADLDNAAFFGEDDKSHEWALCPTKVGEARHGRRV